MRGSSEKRRLPATAILSSKELTDHFARIGLVASGWAAFELSLDLYALILARVPTMIGCCFTAQVAGSGRKLDAYIAVARERGADAFMDELNTFAKVTTGLADRRNRIVHDPWVTINDGAASRFEVTARRRLKRQLVTVSNAEIEKLIDDISKHRDRFSALHERIEAAVDT